MADKKKQKTAAKKKLPSKKKETHKTEQEVRSNYRLVG